jgi:hypothetical protein
MYPLVLHFVPVPARPSHGLPAASSARLDNDEVPRLTGMVCSADSSIILLPRTTRTGLRLPGPSPDAPQGTF